MRTYILLFRCKDQKGVVAKISQALYGLQGNILTADQHSSDPYNGDFFMRVEFLVDQPGIGHDQVRQACGKVAEEFTAVWSVHEKEALLRMGVLVSGSDHCLAELLYSWRAGQLKADIPFVISNYERHRELARQYGILFHYVPATADQRRESEILTLVSGCDFLVLARYMLVLSPDFLRQYARPIINIHHGLLPSFKGAHPYRQAHEQGVKVIGATAHFVTEKLDEGPINTQMVCDVSHKDDVAGLVRKGRDLEKLALARAVSCYIDHRVMVYGNKTIVF